MRVITYSNIKNEKIEPKQCYEWVSDVIKNKSKAILPAKISLKPDIEGVFYNTMPSIIPEADCAGIKLVTRYPDREPSLDSQILLYNLKTGKNIALLDGNWITAMRTGAVAAHSISLLAVKDFSTLGFIGLGNTARTTLMVLEALYPKRQMTIKLKSYKNQHILFAERFKDYTNITFEYCDTYKAVIEDSDVVISAATVFEQDICDDKYFKKGILVVPIHTRGFTNCDLFFDKVYADDVNHVKGFKNFDKFKFFSEVSEVVNGVNPGRQNDEERILAYNIGISLHDIYFAKKIYDIIADKCQDVSLDAPRDKFWV